MILQLIRFGVIGTGAMLMHWLVVRALVPLGMAPLTANLFGFGISFNISYFGHRNWTFMSNTQHRVTFRRFLTVALAGFALNEALYFILLRSTTLSYQTALAIVLVSVAALTFFLSKTWAFRCS